MKHMMCENRRTKSSNQIRSLPQIQKSPVQTGRFCIWRRERDWLSSPYRRPSGLRPRVVPPLPKTLGRVLSNIGFEPNPLTTPDTKKPGTDRAFLYLAEREGFEPSIRDKPYTPLAGERLQPLGHLSVRPKVYL